MPSEDRVPVKEAEPGVWPEVLRPPVLRLLTQRQVLAVQKLEEPLAELPPEDQRVETRLAVCGHGPSLLNIFLSADCSLRRNVFL